MSVIVKNMEMPKCCTECSCCRHDNWNGETAHQCNVSLITFGAEDENWIYDQRPNWCPLVEILTPHGRLVDLDKMVDEYWDGSAMRIDETDLKEIEEYDVVIEAEDGT